MSEYRHTIHKTPNQSVSQDPPQNISNAGDMPGLNQSLTIQNGVQIAVAGSAIKKVITTVGNASIEQMGNSQIEKFTNLSNKIGGYLTTGAITGYNPYVLGAKFLGDITTVAVEQAVEFQAINYENERIEKTRGVIRSSLGGYYG